MPNAPHWSTPPLNVIDPQAKVEALVIPPGAKTEAGEGGAVRTRHAIIFRPVIVSGAPHVIDGIAASAAVATPHKILVTQQAAKQQLAAQPFKPALRIDFWSHWLPKIYSQHKSRSLLSQLQQGVRIGRPVADRTIVSHNWPSALEHREQVSKIIADDLAAGRLDGPYLSPPFTNFIVSPLGAFTKRNSSKVRLIHDLSYPKEGSVNASIKKEEFTLSYSSVDDAVALCKQLGPGRVYMAKLDLQDAFKHVYVDPRDWHMLGFAWPDANGRNVFYFSRVLNFGLRSSPYLFDLFASALLDIIHFRGVPQNIVRYVDDFIIIASTAQECQNYLDSVLSICKDAGFTIQASKITSPATITEFLGIVIDSNREELRISAERLRDISLEVDTWLSCCKATKRQLLSLIGKLSFASRVVRTGKAFISRLLHATKRASALHHHVKLTHDAKADLRWWSLCMRSHNGVSFYNPSWAHEGVVDVYTDASNEALGAFYRDQWIQISYSGSFAYMKEKSINWREFHAAVTALATWADDLREKSVIFHIDNMVVCHILNSLYSPVQDLMHFVRHWCLLIEKFKIQVAVVYIDTKENIDADDLSRLRSKEFLDRNPNASPFMTWPDQGFMSPQAQL